MGKWARCVFFSCRRRHTRCGRDWSSDVCSSDLRWALDPANKAALIDLIVQHIKTSTAIAERRSEERRVGKEGRHEGSAAHWERCVMKVQTRTQAWESDMQKLEDKGQEGNGDTQA